MIIIHLFVCLDLPSSPTGFVHDQFTNAYVGTDGVDFALKTIYWDQHTTITSQFWVFFCFFFFSFSPVSQTLTFLASHRQQDIPGKERYGKMTRVIYQGSVGAVVVTDFVRIFFFFFHPFFFFFIPSAFCGSTLTTEDLFCLMIRLLLISSNQPRCGLTTSKVRSHSTPTSPCPSSS